MNLNEILESLYRRKSVRAYTNEPVSADLKRQVLEAAVQAPTAGNQQLYTILDITDQALKAKLAVTCDNQPFIAAAPVVLIFCADCQKWLDVYAEAGCTPRSPGAGDLLLATADAIIAAQNAVVAAEILGLGSCYIGDIMEHCEEHRALLSLPEYVCPVAMLVLGWPTQQQKDRVKPQRADLRYLVRENAYAPLTGAELRDMLAKDAGARGFDPWVSAFCARKYNSDFSREMSRSMAAYLRPFLQ